VLPVDLSDGPLVSATFASEAVPFWAGPFDAWLSDADSLEFAVPEGVEAAEAELISLRI
jgi:hypothetical protein